MCFLFVGNIKDELLEGYTEYDEKDKLVLTVRLAVVMAVVLTIPLVHYPVSIWEENIALSMISQIHLGLDCEPLSLGRHEYFNSIG